MELSGDVVSDSYRRDERPEVTLDINDVQRMIIVRLRLIDARERNHLTQGEAARLLGIHRPTLSNVESGKQKLTVDLLFKLCDLYQTYPAGILRPGEETTYQSYRERRVIGEEG